MLVMFDTNETDYYYTERYLTSTLFPLVAVTIEAFADIADPVEEGLDYRKDTTAQEAVPACHHKGETGQVALIEWVLCNSAVAAVVADAHAAVVAADFFVAHISAAAAVAASSVKNQTQRNPRNFLQLAAAAAFVVVAAQVDGSGAPAAAAVVASAVAVAAVAADLAVVAWFLL